MYGILSVLSSLPNQRCIILNFDSTSFNVIIPVPVVAQGEKYPVLKLVTD